MKIGKKTELGKIILVKLVSLEKNQTWLAAQIRTSSERISAYVTGRATPSVRHIYAMSCALGVSCDELISAITKEDDSNHEGDMDNDKRTCSYTRDNPTSCFEVS